MSVYYSAEGEGKIQEMIKRDCGELFQFEPRVDRVSVFHDETKKVKNKNDWGHGLLFVPDTAESDLLKELDKARAETGCNRKLHFKDISEKCSTRLFKCAKKYIEIGTSYMSKDKGCKLAIIFCDKSETNLYLYSGDEKERSLRFMETLLRMVLKGGLHFLYCDEWQVGLLEVVTDGNPWHRELDSERIIERLCKEKREYVRISRKVPIRSVLSDHTDKRCKDPSAAEILQLTDLLLGSVIQCCARELSKGSKKEQLIRPVREILERKNRGKSFRYSNYFMSFTTSRARIQDGNWVFEQLPIKPLESTEKYSGTLFSSI